MAAEIQVTFEPRLQSRSRYLPQHFADRALRATARLWFVVTIAGQLLFAFTVASYYSLTAARGDLQAWNRRMMHGYVAGDPAGNLVVAMHLLSAVIVIVAGALQFVPQIRSRFPRFHRWNGRLYVLTALTLSGAGLYMQWVRGTFGDVTLGIGSTLNAVLIWVCAVMALHYAIARDLPRHRRWTLRLFLVVSAAWFFRAAFFLILVIFKGPVGFDPNTFTGPLLTFLTFAQSVFPLAILELYFRAQKRPGALRRLAMAGTLLVLTVATGAGVFAVSAFVWVPSLNAAYDDRKSIVQALSVTIATRGVDAAVGQYRHLKATKPTVWNFDENQLNSLGYQLLRANKYSEAIRVFQLNVEAYPQSSNVYDSLAEAYLRDRDEGRAAANYRRALELDPNNRNAVEALRKLGAL